MALKDFHNIMNDIYKECRDFYQVHSLSEEEISSFTKNLLTSCKLKIQESKIQNQQDVIKHKILKLKIELETMWEKCYFPVEKRNHFPEIELEEFSHDLLNNIIKEIDKVKEYYDENKNLLHGIEKFNTLLDRITQLDSRAQNPLKYQNRGAQMLKDEKDKKIAMKELQKAQKELIHLSQEHHSKHGFHFLINGQKVSSFLEKVSKMSYFPKSGKKENYKELTTCSAVKRKQTFETPDSSKRMKCTTDIKKQPCTKIRKPKAVKVLLSSEIE